MSEIIIGQGQFLGCDIKTIVQTMVEILVDKHSINGVRIYKTSANFNGLNVYMECNIKSIKTGERKLTIRYNSHPYTAIDVFNTNKDTKEYIIESVMRNYYKYCDEHSKNFFLNAPHKMPNENEKL